MSSLKFDPELGVVVPTTQEIRERRVAEFEDIFSTSPYDGAKVNTDPTSPLGQVIDLGVAEEEARNSLLTFLANMFDMKTATGKFLDALCSLYFIERKVSEPTIVECLCTGLPGTKIPFGVVVKDGNGNQFRCYEAQGVTIGNDGRALVSFSAVEHGALVVQPETVTNIVTTIPGWSTVTNPAAGVTGRDRESDSELRARALKSVSVNAHSTVESITAEVAGLTGVIDCAVLENVSNEPVTQFGVEVGGHSIAVCVSGGDDQEIAKAIYTKKDAGCGTSGNRTINVVDEQYSLAPYAIKIVRPTVTNLYVRVEFFSDSLGDSVKESVKKAIVNDALGLGSHPRLGLAQTLYGSRFWQAIVAVTSVPVRSVTMSLGDDQHFSDSIVINADVEPVITTKTVSIVSGG